MYIEIDLDIITVGTDLDLEYMDLISAFITLCVDSKF